MAFETIPANDRISGPYVASAGQTTFNFDFPVYQPVEIIVHRSRQASGSILILSLDYTLTIDPNGNGGAVELLIASQANDNITILGNTSRARETAFDPRGDFTATEVNRQLNRVLMLAQEHASKFKRVLCAPIGEQLLEMSPAVTRAGNLAGFGALPEAALIPVKGVTPPTLPVTPYMATVLDDLDAPSARRSLNIDLVHPRDFGPLGVTPAQDAAALSAAIAEAALRGRTLVGPPSRLVLPATGLRASLLAGSRLTIRDLQLDLSGVATPMTLATGWSSKIGLGLIAENAAGLDMWAASYPRAALTAAATRGDVAIGVSDLSLFAPGDDVLIHDTSRVWDADGTICSEGVTVRSRSGVFGAGTLTLAGSLRSSYTAAATVRRWVDASVHIDGLDLIGAGAGGDQDGLWMWGVRAAVVNNVAVAGVENRAIVGCNGHRLMATNIRGRGVARNGLGYLLATNGTHRTIAGNLDASDCRHVFASGRAPGGSQMQSIVALDGVTVDGSQDCAVNAHPGVYAMTVSNVVARGARNADTNGDGLIIFQGTHLTASNIGGGPQRRHGVIIESFGHLDEAGGHSYRLTNTRTDAGLDAITQYGFVFSDAPCTAANGFTGAASSPVDVIELTACDFRSRSGSLLVAGVSTIRDVRINGGSMRSLGPAQHGHGLQTLVAGTGAIQRIATSTTTFESNGGAGFAGAFFAGRAGAPIAVHAAGGATRGANQWGLRVDQGSLTHAPLDAVGFSATATVAGTGGTLTPY